MSDHEESDNESFIGHWFDGDEPYLFNGKHDGFLVESNKPSRIGNAGSINLFARSLCSYRKGSIVSKQCEPYGELDVFADGCFIVKKKFFRRDGQVKLVLLKKQSSSSQFLLVAPPLFSGWTDTDAIGAYQDYHKTLDK